MKLENIIKFNEANVQRIIANHTASDAAKIIIEKWGSEKAIEDEQPAQTAFPTEEAIQNKCYTYKDTFQRVGFKSAIEWMRSQVKPIDLREELMKFAKQFYADEETCIHNVNEYLNSKQ